LPVKSYRIEMVWA